MNGHKKFVEFRWVGRELERTKEQIAEELQLSQKKMGMRRALALATVFAAKLDRSENGFVHLDLIASAVRIPNTRAGGSRFTRLLKHLGLYPSQASGSRYATAIEHYLDLDLEDGELRELILREGLTPILPKPWARVGRSESERDDETADPPTSRGFVADRRRDRHRPKAPHGTEDRGHRAKPRPPGGRKSRRDRGLRARPR